MKIEVDDREIELSRPEKVLFPEVGLTKADLADYYRRIAGVMVPHALDRPVTLQRFPDGVTKGGFYQKEASDYFPDWIPRATVAKEGGEVHQVLIDGAATLVYLAGQGTITPHLWLSRIDRPHHPDRMIVDLDPPDGFAFALVRATAKRLRTLLEALGLVPFVMTTGSRGLHVTVPLDRSADFDAVRVFAHRLADRLALDDPEHLTVELRKAKRDGRLFLDVQRNAYAQMAVAPYAVRARPGAPVATPLDWSELDADLGPRDYGVSNLFRRLGQKRDPWRDIDRHARPVAEAASRLGEQGV